MGKNNPGKMPAKKIETKAMKIKRLIKALNMAAADWREQKDRADLLNHLALMLKSAGNHGFDLKCICPTCQDIRKDLEEAEKAGYFPNPEDDALIIGVEF